MYIPRALKGPLSRTGKSILLLGPRQAGKSTLIRSLDPKVTVNLADEEVFVSHLRDPGLLRRIVGTAPSVFVDEVQRIPSLLNTVQALIDETPRRKFYLSGSSARKLKRGKANLLPGRILVYRLGPLAPAELGNRFDLERALTLGLLPEPYLSEDEASAQKLLHSYSITYLKEEVQAEALTRNLEGFSRFFDVIASKAGELIDFSKFASQASIERMSARRYYDVLCDTLILENVEPFAKSSKRRLVQHPRYYFFDVGVLNGTLNNFEVSADRRGALFENLFLQCALSEFRAADQEVRVSFFRTEAGAEVDFVFEIGKRVVAVEVKATKNLGTHDLTGLKSFHDFYGKPCERMIVYLGERTQDFSGEVTAYPFLEGLRALRGA